MEYILKFLGTSIPFGIIMSILFSYQYGAKIGISCGVGAACAFGLFMSVYLVRKRNYSGGF